MDEIRSFEKDLAFLSKSLEQKDENNKWTEAVKDYQQQIQGFREQINGKEVQGIYRPPTAISSMLSNASRQLQDPLVPFTENQKNAYEQAVLRISQLEKEFASFKSTFLPQIRTIVREADVTLFKED
jgi:pantothenate kinase